MQRCIDYRVESIILPNGIGLPTFLAVCALYCQENDGKSNWKNVTRQMGLSEPTIENHLGSLERASLLHLEENGIIKLSKDLGTSLIEYCLGNDNPNYWLIFYNIAASPLHNYCYRNKRYIHRN